MKIMFKIARASGIAFLLAFWALVAPSPVFPAVKNQQAAVEGISNTLDEAIKSYGEGDAVAAKAKISDAYFNIFEASGMEADIASGIR